MTELDGDGKTAGLLPRLRRRISSWSGRPEDSDLSGRSRLLSALLLLLFVWSVAWALFLRFHLMPQAGWSNPEIRVSVVFALVVVLAGLLNRRGRYLPAAVLAVGLLLAGILVSCYFTLKGAMEPMFSRNDAGLLTYLVLPVVIGAVLLPPGLLFIVLACSLGAVLAVPFIFPHMSWTAVLYGPAIYLAVVCGLLAVISYLLSAQQRRNYAELREKEERYRSLFEQSPDANFLISPDGYIRAVNSAGLALFGYGVGELQGQHVKVLYANPADRGPVIGKAERQGHLYDEPVRLRTKDGRVLDCLLTISLRKDAAGRTLEYQTIVRDITSRMQSEEELKLRGQLLDVAQDAVFLVDPGGEIVFANRATAELTGYDIHELVGMNMRRLNTREGAELVPSRIAAMQRDGSLDFETTYVRKDESRVQVEVRSRTIESRGRTLFLSVCRDVTRRKADEAELRLRGELLDGANDAVFLSDLKGKLLYVNEAAAVQRGYTRDELMRMSLWDLDDEKSKERFRDRMMELMNRRTLTFECGHRRKDGTVMPVEVRARLFVSGGQATALAVARDISERRRTQEVLKAERDRAQGYLDIAAVMLVSIDAAGNIAMVNRRGAEMLGSSEKELIGRSWIDTCVPEEQRDYVRSVFADFMAGRAELHEYVVNDMLTLSGERRTIAWHNAVLRDAAGRPAGTLSSGEDVTERNATERALQLSEERFRALYEQSIDAIFENSPDGRKMEANRAWLDLFGYSTEDLATIDVANLYVNPVDRETYARAMRQAGMVKDEVWLKKKDGTAVLCQRVASVRKDSSGNVVAFQGIVRDITALRKSEGALRESEAKYHALFEQSMDAVALVSVDGTLLDANPAYLNLFGHTADAIGQKVTHTHYWNPADRDEMLRLLDRDGVIVDQEVRMRKADGTEMYCIRSIVARRDSQGRLVGLQSVARDITQKKRAERALADELTRRRILVEQSRDGIVVLDQDGKVVEANPRFAEMLGYSPKELLQLNVHDWDVPIPPERLNEMIRTVDESGDHFETQHRRKDGTVYDVEISTNAAAFGGQKLIFCVCRDITGRKRAEEELRRSEEELHMLAGRLEEAREEERTGIARELHDQLGQALTALKFDLQGVLSSVERHVAVSPEKLNGMMSLIDDTSNDIRRISSELRPGMLDDVGLVAAMEWQLAQFGERTGIECRFAAAADDAALDRGRSTALFRILQELLTNVARHAKAKNATVSFEREDDTYILTVADDGIGISPEQASSTSSLGLIGLRERVRPFGGSVQMSGKKDRGTTVRVVLPVS